MTLPETAFWLERPNLAACEIAPLMGYRIVVLDMEHGAIGDETCDAAVAMSSEPAGAVMTLAEGIDLILANGEHDLAAFMLSERAIMMRAGQSEEVIVRHLAKEEREFRTGLQRVLDFAIERVQAKFDARSEARAQ